MDYANQQGQIKPTRQRTGAKRYTGLRHLWGLPVCRVTRLGKTLLSFLDLPPVRNPVELNLAERCAYLYRLLLKDAERLLSSCAPSSAI